MSSHYEMLGFDRSARSHYEVLGIERSETSPAEIKRAYRALALRWHPDKNPNAREEAEARFVEVAAAYECLSNESSREAYNRVRDNPGASSLVAAQHSPFGGFDLFRASKMFGENFGEALASDWSPGMQVSGTLVRGGKRVTVTIFPDGTSEECEATTRGGDMTYVNRSGAGGSFTSVQIQGSVGKALASAIVPESMQRVPVVGPAVSTAVEWLPAAMCIGCCFLCCCRG